jgi:copper chaperone CopZ
MKKQLFFSTLIAPMILLLCAFTVSNPQKNTAEISIKTSVVCEMCKERIEKSLIFEKGVKEVHVDMSKKLVHVKYRTDKTTPENIKLALSKLGYRADEIPADPKGFESLPSCCKAEGCGKD